MDTSRTSSDGGSLESSDGSKSRPSKRSRTDPFTTTLRCEPLQDGAKMRVLWWHSPQPYIPLQTETELIPVLMRWKETERGMLKSQPPFRLPQISKKCRKEQVPLLTALSLRRHHIKRLNPSRTMSQLQLGNEKDIRMSAHLFEQAVERAFQDHIPVWTESQQKAHIKKTRKPDEPFPPTPDFICREPVLVKTYVDKDPKNNRRHRDRRVLQERVVHCKYSVGCVCRGCFTMFLIK